MTTTSLWKFNSSLKKLLNYVTNEEKTNNKEFVSGVNCLPNIAYQEMMNFLSEENHIKEIQEYQDNLVKIFVNIVEQAIQYNLVKGETFFTDSTHKKC